MEPKKRKTAYWTNRTKIKKDHGVLLLERIHPTGSRDTYTVLLDVEDVEVANKRHWRKDKNGAIASWSQEDGKVLITYLSREIVNAREDQEVAVIDHNYNNLRKSNLSVCNNHSCVMRHRRYVASGVYMHYDTKLDKYVVSMSICGYQRTIGHYATKKASIAVLKHLRQTPVDDRMTHAVSEWKKHLTRGTRYITRCNVSHYGREKAPYKVDFMAKYRGVRWTLRAAKILRNAIVNQYIQENT